MCHSSQSFSDAYPSLPERHWQWWAGMVLMECQHYNVTASLYNFYLQIMYELS